MKHRIISFATLWSILGISLWLFGVHAGVIIIAILAFLTQLELYQLFTKMGLKPMKGLGITSGVVITLGAYYLGDIDSGNDLFILSFVVIALIIICLDLQAGRLRSFMPTLFGLIYVPFMLHFLIKIVKLAESHGETAATGMFLALWVVAVAKCADVGGLLVGMKLGKTPLSVISPKKTYEGAAGGIGFSMLIGVILISFFHALVPASALQPFAGSSARGSLWGRLCGGEGRPRSCTPSRSSSVSTSTGKSRRKRRKPRARTGRRGINAVQSSLESCARVRAA